MSMSTFAARKARQVIKNAEAILAVELLCAAQGIDVSAKALGFPELGRGTAAAMRRLRKDVPPTGEDHVRAETRPRRCGSTSLPSN